MRTFLLLLTFFFGLINQCSAQSGGELKLTSPIMVSPQAAAFTKSGTIPVTLNSGVANISIPIYTIATGDINFPIQLSYNASGIKVEEIASSVGLGWNLSYTGNITRQVRGLPDESTWGYNITGSDVEAYVNGQLSPSAIQTFKSQFRAGNIDAEKDIYYFSLPGSVSGKFFLDKNNVYTTIPRSNVRIEYVNVYNGNPSFWRITNDLGVQYIFSQSENTATESYSSTEGSATTNTTSFDGTSAWYVSQIIDAHGNTITFSYTGYSTTFFAKANETKRIEVWGSRESRSKVDNFNSISGPKIQSIHWRGGKIQFTYSNVNRLDIASNDNALAEITLLDNTNTTIKKYKFSTSYFSKCPNTYFNDSTLCYRLKLDSITEVGSTGIENPPYVFKYNPIVMENRKSNNQDRWGYFNGKNNTEFLSYFRVVANGNFIKMGANKDIDTNYNQANLLQKMYYPTGGNSTFEFETNRYNEYKSNSFHTYSPTEFLNTYIDNSGGDPYQYVHIFTQPFSVSAADATYQNTASIKVNIVQQCNNPNNVFCSMVVSVLGSNGQEIQVVHNGDTIYLPVGNYTLQSKIETEFAHTPFASINAKLHMGTLHPPGNYNVLIGGVRIKKIITSDGNNVVSRKTYKYNTFNTNYSSGTIGYVSPENDFYIEDVDNCVGNCNHYYNYVYNSTHHYPLMQTNQGGNVSYANVEEQEEDSLSNNNGKTEYYYTTYNNIGDSGSVEFPYPHLTTFEWTRGLLLKEKNYRRNSDNSYTLIKEKINDYTFLHTPTDTTRRIITGITGASDGVFTVGMSEAGLNAGLKIVHCATASEIYYQKTDTTIIYDGAANAQKTINNYSYQLYPILLNKQETKNSSGETIKSNYKYPLDYTQGGFITTMTTANMIATPIEVYQSKLYANNQEKVIGGVINTYKSNNLLKDKIFKLNLSQSIPISNFSPSIMEPSSTGRLIPFSQYDTLLLYKKYDANANINEQQKIGDVLNTYIWDYNGTYPIAEVKNADSASVAYTSFEADSKGNWNFGGSPTTNVNAITGNKIYNLSSGGVNKFIDISKTYIVSFWANGNATVSGGALYKTGKTVNGFTYKEYQVTNTTNVILSGSGSIDELRLYPKDAQMTTYTFEPLIGMTSQSDVNGTIIYYEYDGFGRLKYIKDVNKNIIKVMDYKYKANITQ